MQYQAHDIVACRSGHVFVITGFKPSRPRYPYIAKAFHGQQKQFKLGDDDIIEKIGTIDPSCAWLGGVDAGDVADDENKKPAHFDEGQRFAVYMAKHGPNHHRDTWAYIATLNYGDDLILFREGAVTFQGIKKSRPKYPVSYSARGGKAYKCSLNMVSTPRN